uniref:Uncharacterized protein n=1 Tax=Anguilla anguilla TaxID=7936 RepID=A0A0E9QWV9_ANGAN
MCLLYSPLHPWNLHHSQREVQPPIKRYCYELERDVFTVWCNTSF